MAKLVGFRGMGWQILEFSRCQYCESLSCSHHKVNLGQLLWRMGSAGVYNHRFVRRTLGSIFQFSQHEVITISEKVLIHKFKKSENYILLLFSYIKKRRQKFLEAIIVSVLILNHLKFKCHIKCVTAGLNASLRVYLNCVVITHIP